MTDQTTDLTETEACPCCNSSKSVGGVWLATPCPVCQEPDRVLRLRAILQDVADDMMFNVAPSKATMAKIHEALS